MTEPLRIPLSPFQQARFAAFQQELQGYQQALQTRVNDTLTGIVAGVVDPSTIQTWRIAVEGTEIVCTPPVEQSGPVLVVGEGAA